MTGPPIRLLLVTGRADVGGGPRHVDGLVRHLPSDFQVFVACPDEAPYAPAWRAHPGVHGMLPLPARRFSPVALLRLVAWARREHMDVVYSHGPSGGLYARLLKTLMPRLRIVHAFHGIHAAQYGTIRRWGYLFVERVLRRLTNRFVHVSTGERDAAVAAGLSVSERAVVVHNGIANADVPDPAAFPQFADPSRPVIAMLTRFVYAKHMELAFDIARRAHQSHPAWQFVWAGDGPDRTRFECAVRDAALANVTFLGVIARPADLLGRARVLLSTSRWEGLPYALLEAGALGVPVVATRVVGNCDVIDDGVNGYLFPVDLPDAGVAALERVLEHPIEAQRLAAAGRQVIAERFSLEQSITRIVQVLREVARPVGGR